MSFLSSPSSSTDILVSLGLYSKSLLNQEQSSGVEIFLGQIPLLFSRLLHLLTQFHPMIICNPIYSRTHGLYLSQSWWTEFSNVILLVLLMREGPNTFNGVERSPVKSVPSMIRGQGSTVAKSSQWEDGRGPSDLSPRRKQRQQGEANLPYLPSWTLCCVMWIAR